MDQMIGTWLDGRYEILSVLGVGGMAVVYKARCHRLNRFVAVKVLKKELAQDEEIRNRFHDESQAVAMMSHPNIVSVYDVSQSDGVEYIVMELIDGITLKQYMKKRGTALNWREALHFSTQIFSALKHAHSRGIVHRDIKPQNILVLRDGSVKVTDFGIARIADSQRTMVGETIGSVHYISPEQAKGLDIDGRSDLYSAGVVLYEMLTGRLPFEGESAVAVALAHIQSIPLTPREVEPSIPVGMEQITMKCMAPDCANRYPNADAVLNDLETFRRDPETTFEMGNLWIPTDKGDTTLPSDPAQPPLGHTADPDEDGEEQEEDTGKGKRRAVMIVTVLAILVGMGVLLGVVGKNVILPLISGGTTYTVPALVGMTEDEARQYILEHEEFNGFFTLTVSDEVVYDDSYEEGQIISQTPRGDSKTHNEKTDITVVLNSEAGKPEELLMPDIVGKNYREWTQKLENDYGVTVKYNARNSDDFAEGEIISTEPLADTPLKRGQVVSIYFSKGPEVKKVPMISVTGLPLDTARRKLTEIGLNVGETISVESDMEKDTVVYQSIPVSTEVNAGTEVNLHISAGKSEPSHGDDITVPPDSTGGDTTPDDEPDQPGEVQQEISRLTIALPEAEEHLYHVVVRISGQGELYNSKNVEGGQRLVLTISGKTDGLSVTVDGEHYTNYTLEKANG